jgi:ABC-2 type transport system permease protein
VVYQYDPTRSEAVVARARFDDALQRALGRTDVAPTREVLVKEPGARYIDRLIPGLIGVNAMGGGLWGIGFLLVNFRIGKLLKRFAATPMPRRNFLLALFGARLTFLLPDLLVLLALGVFGFGMPVRGNLALLVLVDIVGSLSFVGIGMLVASRASTTEAVSGLMNLVMIPMWMFSGVFFSYQNFPDTFHPFIRALPLTQLVDALRLVILEGATLIDVSSHLLILGAWAVGTFLLALRIFKWT